MYVYAGFSTESVSPFPYVQIHDVGVLVEESVNWTVSGAVPDKMFAEKEATGTDVATGLAVIVCMHELAPMEFVEVRVTV